MYFHTQVITVKMQSRNSGNQNRIILIGCVLLLLVTGVLYFVKRMEANKLHSQLGITKVKCSIIILLNISFCISVGALSIPFINPRHVGGHGYIIVVCSSVCLFF